MNILAFYPSYKLSNHNCCVAIATDWKLVYAYEERKLSRVNYRESMYFPDREALSALYTSKIDPKSIDLICVVGPVTVSIGESLRAFYDYCVPFNDPRDSAFETKIAGMTMRRLQDYCWKMAAKLVRGSTSREPG